MFGYVEHYYRYVWQSFGEDEVTITLLGTFLLTFVTVWGWSLAFSVVDLYQWPKWMVRLKIQQGTNQPVDRAKLWNACKVAFVNTTVMNVSWSVIIFPVQQYMGCSAHPTHIPSFLVLLRDMVIFTVIEEIGFYYTHRLVHWGPLYRWYHKQHHEWTAPVGIVSHYAHPVEHFLSHSIPFELGPILCGSHLCTMWLWILVGMTITVMHHSGYHLPLVDSPEFHDFHHLKFNVNYGGMGWLDRLHGTDHVFQGTVQKERHFTFYDITKTIRDYVPDGKNNKPNSGVLSNGLSKGYREGVHGKEKSI